MGRLQAELDLGGAIDPVGSCDGTATVCRIEAVDDRPKVGVQREERADPVHSSEG